MIPRSGRSPAKGIGYPLHYSWASLVAQVVKNLPAMGWEGNDNPLQYSCLENLHGQGSLAGYSPWGHKESDTTNHSFLERVQCMLF